MNKTQAAKLLTAAEMGVFLASQPAAMKELSAARLAGKVKRARTMRDKFRDLLKRQAVATRGRTGAKSGTSGQANERTALKAQVFDEVLERFGTRLASVEQAAARELAKAAAAKAKAEAAAAKVKARAEAQAAKAAAKAPARTAAPKAAAKAPAEGTARTAAKTALQAAVKAPMRKAPAKKAAAKATPATAQPVATPKPPAASKSTRTRAGAAAKQSLMAASRTKPIQAHVASAGRRNQAKRDNRR